MADWLSSGMKPPIAFEEIKAFRHRPSLMLVGHEPDLSQLIAFLLGLATPMQVVVRKASLTSLALLSRKSRHRSTRLLPSHAK